MDYNRREVDDIHIYIYIYIYIHTHTHFIHTMSYKYILTFQSSELLNIRLDPDKKLDKDVFHSIKTKKGYPLN